MRKDYDRFIEIIPKEIAKYDYFKQECALSLLRDNYEDSFKDFKVSFDIGLLEFSCLFNSSTLSK